MRYLLTGNGKSLCVGFRGCLPKPCNSTLAEPRVKHDESPRGVAASKIKLAGPADAGPVLDG